MNSQSLQKLNTILNGVSKGEFFLEQILAHYKITPKIILECLSICEIIKLFYKIKKYVESRDRFFISSETSHINNDAELEKEKHIEKLFFSDHKTDRSQHDPVEMKTQLSAILERLRSQDKGNVTSVFKDVLGRSTKNMSIISSLPIPQKVKAPLAARRLKQIKLGEAIHLLRPLIYCLAQICYGVNSYKPYFISLVLDLVRILLQRKTEFFDPKELEEYKLRNKDILINYMLRNPFYTNILQNMILTPLLDKLFPRLPFVKKIIFYILELRSSLSLLL